MKGKITYYRANLNCQRCKGTGKVDSNFFKGIDCDCVKDNNDCPTCVLIASGGIFSGGKCEIHNT